MKKRISRSGRNPTTRRYVHRRGPKQTKLMVIQHLTLAKYRREKGLGVSEMTPAICKQIWDSKKDWQAAANLKNKKRGYKSSLSLCESFRQSYYRREI